MAQTTQTTREEGKTVQQQGRTTSTEALQELVDRIFEMPLEAQLGIVRTVVPKVLSRLEGEQKEGFLRDFRKEIERAERGEPSYDVRPDVPTTH
jgi:hypothetical protein